MDLRQLEMLLGVVESGGYMKAGEALHISHSAIHRQIRMLEEEVGERILARTGRHVHLTEAGHILAGLAERIRREMSGARQQIEDLSQLRSGHLRIGTGTTIVVLFLAPVLSRFCKQHPQVEVQTVNGTADYVVEEVSRGNLDLGIVFEPADVPRGTRPVQSEVLYREEFVWAVPAGHPLSGCKTVSLARLAEFPLIMYSKLSHVRRMFERTFDKAGLSPKIVMEIENEEAIELMLRFNLGLAPVTKRRAIRDRLDYLRLPEQRMTCAVGLVYPKQDYLSRPVKEFLELCRKGATRIADRS